MGGARAPGQGNAAIAAAKPRWSPRRAFGDTAPPLNGRHLRFQNGQQKHYPRLILDEKFKDYLGEKALKVMGDNFVPSTDERLLNNARNDFLGEMIQVHEGSLPISRRP